jgi:hypothetical protein
MDTVPVAHQLAINSSSHQNIGHEYHTITSTETLIDASKGVGLEVNVEKTKYML